MKRMKQLLGIVLSLMLAVGSLPMPAYAAETGEIVVEGETAVEESEAEAPEIKDISEAEASETTDASEDEEPEDAIEEDAPQEAPQPQDEAQEAPQEEPQGKVGTCIGCQGVCRIQGQQADQENIQNRDHRY